jgi:hypothetical protein
MLAGIERHEREFAQHAGQLRQSGSGTVEHRPLEPLSVDLEKRRAVRTQEGVAYTVQPDQTHRLPSNVARPQCSRLVRFRHREQRG